MGYNNNQFFRLPDNEYVVSPYGASPYQNGNPKFVYPDRDVRYLDANGNLVTQSLKRGYIRSLTTNVQGQDFKIHKCAFQFNPQTIQHDVTLANSYYNVLHQPPEQFTQPMPGNTSFTFTLLFDRSMEVNNPTSTDRINEANPWELSDPSQVGVLRDLQAFYAVVGQGISEAQKDFLVAKLQNTTTLEARQRQEAGDELSQGDVDAAVGSAGDYINANVGNNAFLIPVPVRVLFSSLYMVEGIVTNTNTELLKFSTNMVPMIAKVVVSMEAKYVGFAREKTYLTEQLARTVEAFKEEQKEERDRINDTAAVLTAGVGTVQMAFGEEGTELDRYVGKYPSDKGLSITSMLEDSPGSHSYRLWFNIPGVYNNSDNEITKKFDEGDSMGISVRPTLSVYGPFTAAEHNAYSGDQVAMAAKCKPSKLLLQAVGTLGERGNVVTKQDWNNGARASNGDLVKTTKQVSDTGSKYFITRYEVSATIVSDSIGGITTEKAVSGFGDVYEAEGPGFSGDDDSDGLEYTLSIGWPRATLQDGQAVLSGDNTATDPKAAGSTSSVGRGGGGGNRLS